MDNGVEATGKDKARPISEKYDKTPIDLMKILLL